MVVRMAKVGRGEVVWLAYRPEGLMRSLYPGQWSRTPIPLID